jgi:hypothetical protein
LATRPINETLDLRFADNVRRGLFPSNFQSYDELLAYLNLLHSEGKSKAQIEEAIGIKTGRDFSYAKSGGFSLNTRKMAELIPLGLIDHIKKQEAAGIFPPGTAKKYVDDVHRTWNESSKRTQQLAATTAGYWDNGHWIAAKDTKNLGPTTGRNANPEPQKSFIGAGGIPIPGNAVHQERPRANINQAGLDDLGIPKNWFEDFYEFIMRDPDLNGTGRSMGSGLGRTMTTAEAMRVNSGFATPGQLAAQVNLEDQFIAQGVPAESVNPNLTKAGKVTQVRGPLFKEVSKGKAPRGLMPRTLNKAGPIAAGLGIATALLSDNPAEAIPVAAESLTPLGDIQGTPEPAITMVNVGGKLRPLNTDTNTLMDKPGYGLEQKGGQWREVQRGTGAATKQQQQVIQQTVQQVTNLMPKVNKVVNPVGAKITNEAQYFIVNPIRSAYDRIFGKRDI